MVHGDLSPYNLLVWGDRFYFIDVPQAVDPIAHLTPYAGCSPPWTDRVAYRSS